MTDISDLEPLRTRFAPSPTGALHAGTVRTALFAWLSARSSGGQFILRIEDTDKNREVDGAVKNITDSLKYLGIDWDAGPDKEDFNGPYFQSQRLDIYHEWAKRLINAGRAYADPYTPEQVQRFREEAQKAKKPFLYRHHRPESPPNWDGESPLRFRSEPKDYRWHDLVMGELSAPPEVIDDFILIKSDGFPTYNFAHIVDDSLMGINLVLRSQEFLSSMPIFLNLYEALNIPLPKFATVPMVMDVSGNKKLSKRAGAKQLLEYKAMGILPQALINALATTGWNDGTDQEIFSLDEIISKFSLNRIQRSPARFDEQRLVWMNGYYIRHQDIDQLYILSRLFWPDAANHADDSYKKEVLKLLQERLKYLGEIKDLSSFFFREPDLDKVMELYLNPVDKQLKKVELNQIIKMLKETADSLSNSDFNQADLNDKLNDLLISLETKPGILFAAIRIAISGSTVSPEISGTMACLGAKTVSKRLAAAIGALEKQA